MRKIQIRIYQDTYDRLNSLKVDGHYHYVDEIIDNLLDLAGVPKKDELKFEQVAMPTHADK